LAQGINMGMQLRNQQQYLDMQQQHQDRMAKADARDAEIHELRKDQYASEKEIRDRRNRAFAQIADFTAKALGGSDPNALPAAPANMQDPNAPSFGAPPAQQTPSNIQLAGPIPQGGLSMAAPAAPYAPNNPAGALAPATQPAPAEKPSKVLERGMVTGAYTPEMLTQIANIFAQNGLHEEGINYMNQAYTAQTRGFTRAAMAFMQNNPGAGVEALKAGGMQVEGTPVKVKPNDPNDHNWKINIGGQGEKTVNIKDLLQSTMDPEKFFEVEDKKRKAAMDEQKMTLEERKQSNDDAKTKAEIGYLRSRSTLAEANADKADRYEPGGLKPSRSSEAQINTAIGRRDKAFDRVSSVKNEEGKFEVDPQKRQALDTAANQYLTFLEEQRGEELDAREHHKFTDVMLTYPVGGTPAQIKQWQKTQFLPRFGGRAEKQESGNSPAQPIPQSGAPAQGLTPAAQPAAPKAGSLAALQERQKGVAALNAEMAGIQQALKAPNLTVEQKKVLSLKAQEVAMRRDALK
jgi:hypothetical protein